VHPDDRSRGQASCLLAAAPAWSLAVLRRRAGLLRYAAPSGRPRIEGVPLVDADGDSVGAPSPLGAYDFALDHDLPHPRRPPLDDGDSEFGGSASHLLAGEPEIGMVGTAVGRAGQLG